MAAAAVAVAVVVAAVALAAQHTKVQQLPTTTPGQKKESRQPQTREGVPLGPHGRTLCWLSLLLGGVAGGTSVCGAAGCMQGPVVCA